jgi:hypothetical protein
MQNWGSGIRILPYAFCNLQFELSLSMSLLEIRNLKKHFPVTVACHFPHSEVRQS